MILRCAEYKVDIDADVWGRRYKIAMQWLNHTQGSTRQTMTRIVDELFPHDFRGRTKASSRFTQKREGAWPGWHTGRSIESCNASLVEALADMFNGCLRQGHFCKQWKVQRLVLISKGEGDLCMLDTTGKVLEKIIRSRLQSAIQAAGG